MEKSDTVTGVIAIASGGLDSTTMLWDLASRGMEIREVISFDYGQRHQKELTQLELILQEFSQAFHPVTHHSIDLSSIQSLISKGSLTGGEEVPKEMYNTQNQRTTIVPNRNMIFVSIAAGRAVTVGATHVAYAAHSSDYEVYPDCRPEFIEKMDEALYLGNLWDPVRLLAPFQHKTKTQIAKLGNDLDVPLNMTWSCYEGDERPCLECGTCLERTESFLYNQLTDPALTEKEWHRAVGLYKTHSA